MLIICLDRGLGTNSARHAEWYCRYREHDSDRFVHELSVRDFRRNVSVHMH
jgi:hypothetical protein